MKYQTATLAGRTVADLVREDYRRSTVFRHYDIDFCCGGGKTLEDVCASKNIPLADLERDLAEAVWAKGTAGEWRRPNSWSLDFLSDYIVNEHHTYVRETSPLLREYALKIARVHGKLHPELIEIAKRVDELVVEMAVHMAKEEQILFPYIRAMVGADRTGPAPESALFPSVAQPIRMMEHEHDRAGETMREIRRLSNGYTPPEDACNTYRVAFAKLEEFEEDLHLHVHLENNVLFPRAAALEAELSTLQRTN